MPLPRVVLTRRLPEKAMQQLYAAVQSSKIELVQHDSLTTPMSRDELLAACKTASALLCLLTDKVDQELLEASPGLKCVVRLST